MNTTDLENHLREAPRPKPPANLKQLGLAARTWALDNGDMNPPDVLSMSNEIGSFKILVCAVWPELLRLRSEVTRLNARKRELAGVPQEAELSRIWVMRRRWTNLRAIRVHRG